MPRRARQIVPRLESSAFVRFDHGNLTYQIDPDRRKVYRRFVEIETSKAAEIVSLWRAGQEHAADA